jgi:hypothetical protein
MVEFSKAAWVGTGVIDFDRARRWMNQTWGWSQEAETRAQLKKISKTDPNNIQDEINRHWAYSVQYRDYRIYLNSAKELNWFVLAHPNESNS